MNQIRYQTWFSVVVVCAIVPALGCEKKQAVDPPPSRPAPRIASFNTDTITMDRIYHSMQGPVGKVSVDASEFDWVTAIRSEVIDQETQQRMGDEFFCHSNLQLPSGGSPLFTMATGADEIRFPKGFALPLSAILSSQPKPERGLSFVGMVLNNHESEINKQVQVRTHIEYFEDSDFGKGLRPKKLYMSPLIMQVENLEEYKPGEGEPPINEDVTTHCVLVDDTSSSGVKLPLHWMVPPGRQKTRNRDQGFTPVDGTVHFAGVHLHNYGVYMRLTDVTDGKVLFQADVENEPDRDQIAKITHYASAEGFKLYKDHVYEIEALYNNTTDHDIDAMAMMMLYYNPEGDRSIKVRESRKIRALRQRIHRSSQSR